MVEGSDELERLNREQLVLKARVLGVERAELMTRVELRDEIVRRSVSDPSQQKRARGFLGVARDLVASVVEAGLNLPDAAALIRGEGSRDGEWKGPPPVATVTLAEIYAAQGHLERALRMLDEVLAKEPDHDPARALRNRLAAGDSPNASPRKRTKISFAEPPPESTDPDPDTDLEPEIAAEPAPETPEPTPEIPEPAPEPAPAPEIPEPPEPTPELPEPAPAPAPTPELPEPAPAPAPTPELPAPTPEPAPLPEPIPLPIPVPAPHLAPPPPAPSHACLLTLSLSGRRQVYWELPDTTWAPLRARSPQGRAVLRVVSFRTRAGKVERRSLDIAPHAAVGSSELPGLSSDSVVRAALGWEEAGNFTPFVLAADVAPETESAQRAGNFRPHPLVGATPPDAELRALAHLARRA